jgi:hypothetical protein
MLFEFYSYGFGLKGESRKKIQAKKSPKNGAVLNDNHEN